MIFSMSKANQKASQKLNRQLSQQGFSLIEILIAVLILGLSMAAILSTVANTTQSTANARAKSIAHWVAMNKLTELQVSKTWPALSTKKGGTEMGFEDEVWKWQYTVTKTPDNDMRRVDIEVYTPDTVNLGDADPITTLAGYLANTPAPAAKANP